MITVKTKNCLKRFKDDFQNDIISESDIYEQRLAKIGLWSIEDSRVRADHVEVYEIYSYIYGLSTVSFNVFFEYYHHDRTRGHTLKLSKNRVHTNLRQHFFTERNVNIWNKLDILFQHSRSTF